MVIITFSKVVIKINVIMSVKCWAHSCQSIVAATVLFTLKCIAEWPGMEQVLSNWEFSTILGSTAHPNLACLHLSLAGQAIVLLWASSASS